MSIRLFSVVEADPLLPQFLLTRRLFASGSTTPGLIAHRRIRYSSLYAGLSIQACRPANKHAVTSEWATLRTCRPVYLNLGVEGI
jgi:hypothetical protein